MKEPAHDSPQRLQIPAQLLLSDLASPVPQTQENPSKFSYHFILRSVFIALFIALLPLFPSQAPDFINRTISTTSWELLHLLLVGIAVSYGVFCRRNVETEMGNFSKPDNAHSFMSKLFHVSSVFGDEMDSPSWNNNKIQTWNNQYFREEPAVVVSEDAGVNNSDNKPLFLPVRSLKSPVSNPEIVTYDDKNDEHLNYCNGFSSVVNLNGTSDGLKIMLRDESGEIGELGHVELRENLKGPAVFLSPDQRRSRSGRMEVKEELRMDSPVVPESEVGRFESPSYSSPVPFSPQSNSSATPSPKNLSPSPSLSPNFHGKKGEELVKRKGSYRSSAPPPPTMRKSQSQVVNSSIVTERDTRRSSKDEVRDFNRGGGENLLSVSDLRSASFRREIKGDYNGGSLVGALDSRGTESFKLVTRAKHYDEGPLMGRADSLDGQDFGSESFRSERKAKHYSESSSMGRSDLWSSSRDSSSESFQLEMKVKRYNEGSSIGKSVRTIRPNSGDRMKTKNRKRSNEMETVLVEKTGRHPGCDQLANMNENGSFETPRPPSEYLTKEAIEKVIVESEDSESGDSNNSSDFGEDAASISAVVGKPDENEVDKKAGEFIAKFREQIRLQRIDAVKKSTRQSTNGGSR